MTRRGESKRNPVLLRVAKHLDARPDRPFAAAQGDTVRQLRVMRIGCRHRLSSLRLPWRCWRMRSSAPHARSSLEAHPPSLSSPLRSSRPWQMASRS